MTREERWQRIEDAARAVVERWNIEEEAGEDLEQALRAALSAPEEASAPRGPDYLPPVRVFPEHIGPDGYLVTTRAAPSPPMEREGRCPECGHDHLGARCQYERCFCGGSGRTTREP